MAAERGAQLSGAVWTKESQRDPAGLAATTSSLLILGMRGDETAARQAARWDRTCIFK